MHGLVQKPLEPSLYCNSLLSGAKCFLGEWFTKWNMTNQISQYVHKRFFYRIFRSQFWSTQKLEKSLSETEISNLGNIAWFHFSEQYLLKYRIEFKWYSRKNVWKSNNYKVRKTYLLRSNAIKVQQISPTESMDYPCFLVGRSLSELILEASINAQFLAVIFAGSDSQRPHWWRRQGGVVVNENESRFLLQIWHIIRAVEIF